MQNVPRLSAAGTDGRSDRTGVRDASVIDFSQARTGHLRADNLLRPVPTTPRSTNRPPPKNGRRFNHQGPIIGGSGGRVKRRLDGNGLIIALFAGLSSGPQRQVGRSRAEGTVVASAVAVAMTSARRRSAAPHADRLLRRDATVCIGLRAQPVDATPSILIRQGFEAYGLAATWLSDDPRLYKHE